MKRRRDHNYDRQLIGLAGSAELTGALPLVHVTPAWTAKEIVRTKKLTTSKCSVFNADLLYFFILRPSYQTRIGAEQSHQLSRFPVAFVFEQNAVPSPRHIYPFDTGAAAAGAFDGTADPLVPLEDYALSPNYESARQFISWAFENLRSYFNAQISPSLWERIEPFQSVAVGYQDIARLGVDGNNDHDTRSCTIEVASSHNVELEGKIKLIIVPKQFIEGNESFQDAVKILNPHGCDIELYDWQPNRSPNEFQADLFRISKKWYEQMGVL